MGSNGNKSIRWYTRKYPKHDHTCDYTITNWFFYLRSCLFWLSNPIYYNPTYIMYIIQISIYICIYIYNYNQFFSWDRHPIVISDIDPHHGIVFPSSPPPLMIKRPSRRALKVLKLPLAMATMSSSTMPKSHPEVELGFCMFLLLGCSWAMFEQQSAQRWEWRGNNIMRKHW